MKVAIITYSTYGHINTLAKSIQQGVIESKLADTVDIFQVQETLSDNVLQMINAPPKDSEIPLADSETLTKYDAFLFGCPTRYGNAPAQFSAFFDATGGLWAQGALQGKPAGFFVSTGTLGGGQEVTIRNMLSFLVHHGMIYVPTGYAAFEDMANMEEVHGGSPYGAGTFAGADGSRQPSDLEKRIAKVQGETFAKTASKLSVKPAEEPTKEEPKKEQAETANKRTEQSTKTPEVQEKSGCAKCIIM